jgi:adenosylmethionine-8-amino-7-oxononanoate aminotransferase
MESATISALAALAGAAVGGVTSVATTWLTQKTQARIQELTHKLSRREELYKAFIEEAARLYADALVHEITDVSKLVGLYAMISEMRVLSSRNTIESADEVARMILNTYRAPNKTLPELQDMVNRGAIDVLQTFSEAARQEFRRLGV